METLYFVLGMLSVAVVMAVVLGWQDEKDIERILNAMSKMDSEGYVPKDVLL